jgi:aspartyl/asparaginyl beta-hydroxylase (cupin superfamily)
VDITYILRIDTLLTHHTIQPYWDTSDTTNFPWATKLEENSHIIINEFQQKLLYPNKNEEGGLFSGDSAWQSAVMGEGWSAFRLQRLGIWNTENCEVFPQTYELLRSLDIPLAVRGVCFARQAGGSGVGAHSDGRNFILTSHLGLSVPEGEFCWSVNCILFSTKLIYLFRVFCERVLKDAGSKSEVTGEHGVRGS